MEHYKGMYTDKTLLKNVHGLYISKECTRTLLRNVDGWNISKECTQTEHY